MAESPIDERKFTEEELREILERAVERVPGEALPSGGGFSLAEIHSIGAEVGIDPDRLDEAARYVARRGDEPRPAGGSASAVRHRRRVETPFDVGQAGPSLSVIRRVFDTVGEVTRVGDGLEWRSESAGRERLVTISSDGDSTTIEAMSNARERAVSAYVTGAFIAPFSP